MNSTEKMKAILGIVVVMWVVGCGQDARKPASPTEPEPVSPTEPAILTKGQPWTVPGIHLPMQWIPPGTFMMGSPTNESERGGYETQYTVTLSSGFWIGKYEVTQEQWEKEMGSNPSEFREPKNPVDTVSWEDAISFCEKLNRHESFGLPDGFRFNLPTEAQWEYACRAGTSNTYCFGDSLSSAQANFNGNHPYGGAPKGRYLKRTARVGSYKPNAWGLYDMHGNLYEWCRDVYGHYPEKSTTDPVGPKEGGLRVHRGGCWMGHALSCRSADREEVGPGGALQYGWVSACSCPHEN